ncbi:MAG TPA: phosphotransferase family protein [Acidimicrobiales bacterium]
MSTETAAVRPGEELAWDRLQGWLRPQLARLGLDTAAPMSVLQFPNGSANLTYQLSFGPLRLVLRRPPFGRLAPGAHDMRREHRVLSRLWRGYDRAPRAYLFCDDHDVIGGDFVVSEYRSGVVVWGELPPSMAETSGAGRRIGLAVVDALADLHLVDAAALGLADLGRPDGYVQRQIDGWTKRWRLVASEEHGPVMEEVATILGASIPASPGASIIHNDFKPDNCQFAEGRPDRVTAVFDWDMATVGDPLADLGTLLNYWPDPADTPADRALSVEGLERIGLPTRAEVVEHYGARTGIPTDTIGWYEAFACWRTATVCQQLYHRYAIGESGDDRMYQRGLLVGSLAKRALRLALPLSV